MSILSTIKAKVVAFWAKVPLGAREKVERVAVTVIIMGLSLVITDLASISAVWAPAVGAVLNSIKVVLASQYGDPNSGGFVTPVAALDTLQPPT